MSERSERALRKTITMNLVINFAHGYVHILLLTHSVHLARLVRSCFIKNAHNLASLGAGTRNLCSRCSLPHQWLAEDSMFHRVGWS